MPLPIPIIGALVAAGVKGLFDIGATVAANRYNSPQAQKRRLREAGLPLAYMYQGRVNQQSQVPELSIDPDLGTVESQQLDIGQQKTDISREQLFINLQKLGVDLSKLNIDWAKLGIDQEKLGIQKKQLEISQDLLHMKGMLTDAQLEKLAQEVRMLTAGATIKEGEAEWMSSLGDDGKSNQERNLQLQQRVLAADAFLKENQGKIAAIQAEVDELSKVADINARKQGAQKIAQQVTNLVSQDALMRQLYDIRKVDATINETLGSALEKAIENDEEWTVVVYAWLLKALEKL